MRRSPASWLRRSLPRVVSVPENDWIRSINNSVRNQPEGIIPLPAFSWNHESDVKIGGRCALIYCDGIYLAAAAEAGVVVEVEQLEKRRDVVALRGEGLEALGEPCVHLGIGWPAPAEGGGPEINRSGVLGGVGAHPGEDGGIGIGGAHGLEKGLGLDAGEAKETRVERAVVMVIAAGAGEVGTGLVDQAGQVDVAAEADARAAGRVEAEIGGGVVDSHEKQDGIRR